MTVSAEEELAETESDFSYPDDYPQDFINMDRSYGSLWENYRPKVFVGEELWLDLKYFGVVAGTVKLKTLSPKFVGKNKSFHFKANMESASFYKYIYALEDSIESFLTVEDFLPVKYTLIQRESKQSVDDLQVFDHDKLKTYFWYKRIKKGRSPKKFKKESFIPRYVQDSFSALYFVRGLPLKVGDEYKFPVVTRGKIWIITIYVAKQEKIFVNNKEVSAIRLQAQTHYPGVLKKRGDIKFWFSADARRTILKFEAKVKIGTIEGELVKHIK